MRLHTENWKDLFQPQSTNRAPSRSMSDSAPAGAIWPQSKPKQSHQKPMGPISALESKLALGNWTVFSVGFDGGASAPPPIFRLNSTLWGPKDPKIYFGECERHFSTLNFCQKGTSSKFIDIYDWNIWVRGKKVPLTKKGGGRLSCPDR